MENQPRFNLESAQEKWREALAAQSGLTSEDQRELETHLRDSLADLEQRGLNQEESFWLACRRVGPPRQLSDEFLAADPHRVWRERAFWFAAGLLAIQLIGLVCGGILAAGLTGIPEWVSVYAPDWWLDFWKRYSGLPQFLIASVLPVLLVLTLIKRGHLGKASRVVQFGLSSRWRVVLLGTISVVGLNAWYWQLWFGVPGFGIYFAAESVLRYLGLVALVAWLMPVRPRPLVRKIAG